MATVADLGLLTENAETFTQFYTRHHFWLFSLFVKEVRNSIEQTPCWEADSFSNNQISRIYRTRKVHCRFHNSRTASPYLNSIFKTLWKLLRGFCGLGVACWPLVPKFAGSNPAEVVGFFRAKKILSTPSSGGELKPSVPCRRFAACKRSLNLRGSPNLCKIAVHFLAHSSTFRC